MKNTKHYIPNKITLIILGITILSSITYGGFYIVQKKKLNKLRPSKKLIDVTLVDEKEDKDSRLIDTDGDGVYDWIEELWPELDPNNPDSDGDGVSDRKYIQQRQLIQAKERSVDPTTKPKLTESEKLGRSVYTAILAIQNSGGTLDKNTEEQISKNVMNYISDLSIGSNVYIRESINLVPNTKENSYIYRDKMLALFKRYPVNTSDITLIMKSTENPAEHINDIEIVLNRYNSYIRELSKMNVPYVIAGRHTKLLNALGQIEGSLKNLTLDESDDVVSLASLVQLDKTMNTISETILKINTYFKIISDESIF